jgi:hypothetical protein
MRNYGTARTGRTYRTGTPQDNSCFLVLLGLAFMVAVPFFFYRAEVEFHARLKAFNDVGQSVCTIEGGDPMTCANHRGAVHIATPDIMSTVQDPELGVSINEALTLSRQTEYCQWNELTMQNCETCHRSGRDSEGNSYTESYDCNCSLTYYYVKSWSSMRVSSILFDQPAGHHNPQRDPYPSKYFVAQDTVLAGSGKGSGKGSGIYLDPGVLNNEHSSVRAKSRAVNWTTAATREASLWDGVRIWLQSSFLPQPVTDWMFKDETRYEYLKNLKDLPNSEGGTEHKFTYAGNGYLFSPYVPSNFGMAFKLFGQYLDDSLFDWQIGDLMSSCTAGDIRIRYKTMDPTEVSVVGNLYREKDVGNEKLPTYAIEPYVTKDGYTLGLVHAGIHSFEEMFESEAADAEATCWWRRFFLLIWSGVAYSLAADYFGVNVNDVVVNAVYTVGIFTSTLAATWAFIWRSNLICTPSFQYFCDCANETGQCSDAIGSDKDLATLVAILVPFVVFVLNRSGWLEGLKGKLFKKQNAKMNVD